MPRSFRQIPALALTLTLTLTLALAACETTVPPEPAPSAKPLGEVATAPAQEPRVTAPTPSATAPSEPPPAAPAAATAAPIADAPTRKPDRPEYTQYPPDTPKPGELAKFDAVNNAACDSFAEAVRTCLNSGAVQGREKIRLRREMAARVQSWKGKADTESCVQVRAAMREKLKPYGCEI